MPDPKAPGAPTGRSSALYDAVTDEYELSRHELALLDELVGTLDLIDDLAAVLAAEGLMSDSSQGRRVHPAAAELRQQRIVAARLLAALRIPVDEDGMPDGGRRLQRRPVRGFYGMGGDE